MTIENRCFPFGIPVGRGPLLFCFHHAGGNAGQLRSWSGIRSGISVVPVEYAGHGCRMKERFSEDICDIAAELAGEIAKAAEGRRIYIYGHSLGTLIAFETVRILELQGTDVQGLVVAGRGAPFDRDLGGFHSSMGREALIEEMKRLGGMDECFLGDKSFMDYFSPIILSDYRLFERYSYDGGRISAPVCAHCAVDDVDTSPEQMLHWEQVTDSWFEEKTFEGGHFFVLEMEDYKDILLEEVKMMEKGVYCNESR
ncbi:alpha/beta fold hydrolase [Ruminococcus sp.]|uniref:thioesterase II family protein n=1 Tax=Ruminococcus sp. TaxID=41978 RepID=UPI002D1AF400|nr:alpha/beta fold hydrolase [Ruminococcus sp.]HNZ99586.1 alpha/beta fold hydrolase [Ruminococcus sp.]HOH86348.1 alpha/beta fold hydrolase [Ruminococcus sp.]